MIYNSAKEHKEHLDTWIGMCFLFLRKTGKRRGCPRHSSAVPAQRVVYGSEQYSSFISF